MKRNFDKSVDQNISEQSLYWLIGITNRSIGQTKELWEIVGSWKLMLEVEESIKTFNVSYFPGDLGEAFYLIGKLRVWKSMGWVEGNILLYNPYYEMINKYRTHDKLRLF